MKRLRTVLLAALASGSGAFAQETVDVGVIKNEDVHVVQKLLYPKEGRKELGVHLGWMPFDTYTTTPIASLTAAAHLSETFGVEVAAAGGYSFKNAAYKQLEGPAYGISPDAYRFLGSVLADAQWSPIYAKFNWRGARVLHHDFYGLGGLGLTAEQAMMPDHTMAWAPTAGLGLGARVFLQNGNALRLQIRDDVLIEKREKTEDSKGTFVKQNVAVTVGYAFLGGKP